MDPPSVTAVTPLGFMDLPREVRDDIYEAAIFDLSPPNMFRSPEETESLRLRKMDTNVLLTSRQVYWEARDVIVSRAQLIMVSIARRSFGGWFDRLSWTLHGITGIDPMYRNLCIMSHRIDANSDQLASMPGSPFHENKEDWEFILHRQDAEFFLRVIMGEFNYQIEEAFGSTAKHTLNLHCATIYGQHEFRKVYATQALVLQKYRQTFRNFQHFSLRGSSIGWENGLYGAILKDIRSIDERDPVNLTEDIRALEEEGSQVLLKTGDFEAADVPWTKALQKCRLAHDIFLLSKAAMSFGDQDIKAFKTHLERWRQLRRQHGNEFALPFVELSYKLISHRLSGALRFIQQGHHLATRHGRASRPKSNYLFFLRTCFANICFVRHLYGFESFPPPPTLEAQLYFTGAAIYRLLDMTNKALSAYKQIRQAAHLAPDDDSIQQEKERVDAWIRRLVDDGVLASFPKSCAFETITTVFT